MSVFGLFKPKPFVATTEIADGEARAGAELIDDHVGKKKDGVVTKADLDKTRELLKKHDAFVKAGKNEKSPLAALMLKEIATVRASLDHLEAALHGPKPKVGNRVYCTSLRVDTIHDQGAMKTAKFLAANIGGGKAQLNLHEVDEVSGALDVREHGGPPTPAQAAILAKVEAAIVSGDFDLKAFRNIELFMFTGKGGLVQHGPVYISGKPFHGVYKMPLPEGFDFSDAEKTKALLDGLEDDFKDTGYDRVYLKNDKGELFVALNESGGISRVKKGFRAQFKDDGEYKDSGEVLRAVDVDNSVSEAIFGFWSKLAKKLVDGIKGRLTNDETGKAIRDVADKQEGSLTKGENFRAMLLAGSAVASMGVATINLPAAAIVAVGAFTVSTGASLVAMAATDKSDLAVLNRAGVAVNRETAH